MRVTEYYEQLNKLLEGLEMSESTLKPNRIKIPKNPVTVERFNEILSFCKSNLKEYVVTKSGGISFSKANLSKMMESFHYEHGSSWGDITILSAIGYVRVTHAATDISSKDEKPNTMTGSAAFGIFKRLCKDHNINIENYAKDNTESERRFKPPLRIVIKETYFDKWHHHCYHLDLNSSFMSQLAKNYPEFKPVVQELYNKRKENTIYKSVLNNTYGYMMSKWCKYKYAHLSKVMVTENNKVLEELMFNLIEKGYRPLMFNTDGIWYTDLFNQGAYHDENEGPDLGQWKTDYSDCDLLIQGPNNYAIVKDGVTEIKKSGQTNLDKVLSRKYWLPCMIYSNITEPILYKYTDNGITKIGDQNETNSKLQIISQVCRKIYEKRTTSKE